MPKPKNKEELLDQCEKRFNTLIGYLGDLSQDQVDAEFNQGTLNRNCRDVIAHLYHWHIMMMSWYETGMNGKKPKMPAPGYTWRTLPALNKEINLMYQNHSFKKALTVFEGSHQKVISLIQKHNDEELFTKKKYNWTGSTSLAAYLTSSTYSHYDWALKLIKKSLKSLS